MQVIITSFLDPLHLFKRTVVESFLIYILFWRIKNVYIGCKLIIQRTTENNVYYSGNNTDNINRFSLDLNLQRSAQRKRSSNILIGRN